MQKEQVLAPIPEPSSARTNLAANEPPELWGGDRVPTEIDRVPAWAVEN